MTLPAPPATVGETPAGAPSLNERLCHLFRVSLKNGRVHPLYLPVLKYRHAQRDAERP